MDQELNEVDALQAEANRLQREYRSIHRALKDKPDDLDLLKRKKRIRKEYKRLDRKLTRLGEQTEELLSVPPEDVQRQAPAAPFDISKFEVAPFQPHAPVILPEKYTRPPKPPRKRWTPKQIRTVIGWLALMMLSPFFVLLATMDVKFFIVPSSSMEPTLYPGDRLMTYLQEDYYRGEVVVVSDPRDAKERLVKRIVALGGDHVEVRQGTLYVNGSAIDEPYILEPMAYSMRDLTVPRNEVFVLGDNRNNSDDGHEWRRGVAVNKIQGRVEYIYYPWWRQGKLTSYRYAFYDVPKEGRLDRQ